MLNGSYEAKIACDHEIVRAQKKESKGRPNTPPKSWIRDPQVYYEVTRNRALNQMLFQ